MTTDIATIDAAIDRRPLGPLDVTQTKAAMETYQQGLHALLDESDWQSFRDKSGDKQAFCKRSGWRKIATWFELSLETRSIEVERDDDGNPLRARVIARAIAPNGRYAEGEGACAANERRFSKLEHDLQATAATRAINRAISNLVGLGAVSAEEVDSSSDVNEPSPVVPANDELIAKATTELQHELKHVDVREFVRVLGNSFAAGVLPEAAAQTLRGLAFWLQGHPAATGASGADSKD